MAIRALKPFQIALHQRCIDMGDLALDFLRYADLGKLCPRRIQCFAGRPEYLYELAESRRADPWHTMQSEPIFPIIDWRSLRHWPRIIALGGKGDVPPATP